MTVVLVTGATGRIGTRLVPALTNAGYTVRRGTRSPREHGDVLTDFEDDASLQTALAGVDTVVHLASNPRAVRQRSDAWLTERLLTARAAAAPQSELLMLSIVGCDRTPMPYYRAKARAETMVRSAGSQIVRSTQFHGFLTRLLSPLPVLRRPVLPAGWSVQPVDEHFVVEVLIAAVHEPGSAPAEVAGPEQLTVAEAARRLGHQPWQVSVPGGLSRAIRSGSLLAQQGAAVGGVAFGT